MAVLIGVGVLVAFAVLSVAARWAAIQWLHPAARDDANDARSALAETERVFGLSQAEAGALRVPWKDGDKEYGEHDLRLRLDTVAARVPDPKLVKDLTVVRDSLRIVWASAPAHTGPWVYYDGMPPIPVDQTAEPRRLKQQEAADAGRAAVERARPRLSVLERRARQLWSA